MRASEMRGERSLASRVEIESGDRRGRTCMAATAERARDECRVDRFRATPDDDEDPLVHLHEEHERHARR